MKQIALQIQRLRKLRKMSLTDLARESQVQIATLSRIENSKMTGTVQSHFQIARALGVDIAELYQNIQEDTAVPLVEGEKLEIMASPNDKVSTEILSRQAASRKMLPTLIRIAPKGTSTPDKGAPGSERFVFVLSGSVVVHVNGQEIRLKEGASLYFQSSAEHSLENPLSAPAKVLSVMTPVTL